MTWAESPGARGLQKMRVAALSSLFFPNRRHNWRRAGSPVSGKSFDRGFKPESGMEVVMKRSLGLALAAIAACALLAGCASDSVIEAKVKGKLAADSDVKASEISVTAKDHVVTLKGNIDSVSAKEKALQLARETGGVSNVIDEIAVRTSETTGDAPDSGRSVGEKVDDAGITMAVKSKLLDDPDVHGMKIDVDTRGGVVYLTGTVRSETEKTKVVQLAKDTKGVRDVQPNLDIQG